MPDFMRILAVEPTPPVADPPGRGDDDLVWENIHDLVEQAVRGAPDFDFTVLFEGRRDWIDVHAWVVRAGAVESQPLQLSLDRDVCRAPRAVPAPDIALELDVDVDELIDLIDRAVGEAAEYEDAAEGREIALPFEYQDEGLLLEAAAKVAKHLVATDAQVVVRVEARFYQLRLSRAEGAELAPLWPWMTDPVARTLARSVLGRPGKARSLACPRDEEARATRPRASAPLTPLTTGSVRSRTDAAEAIKAKAPGAYAQLLAAWTAPENQEPRADGLRRVLVRKLVAGDAPRAIDVLRAALSGERDSVREAIYDVLSRVEQESASRVLVEGYGRETGNVRQLIGQVLWRREQTTELLVREGLLPAWRTDEEHARRIVRLLKAEYLPVRRAWLAGAPPDLVEALGSLVAE